MNGFDFHTLSLTLDQPFDYYRERIGRTNLGLNEWEAEEGTRERVLGFRHEHAHFTSFVSTGMADFYGVFSDYVFAIFYSVALRHLHPTPGATLEVPLLLDWADNRFLAQPEREALEKLWAQFNELRAFFFGFGSGQTLASLASSEPHDGFWELYFDQRVTRLALRYYELLDCLRTGWSAEELANLRLPVVAVAGEQRVLTARSVMEAYAITIELFNTHFRGFNITQPGRNPEARNPGPHYTVAIQYFLEKLFPSWSLADFMAGKAAKAYYGVAALSYASMQVSIVQELTGNVRIRGGVTTLSPAHRFQKLVDAAAEGVILPAPAKGREATREEILEWFGSCNRVLGSDVALSAAQEAAELFARDTELAQKAADQDSPMHVAWAARANFYLDPDEYVFDAGLFAEKYPCQCLFVRTSDAHLAHLHRESDKFQYRYLMAHAPVVAEAILFGEHWDACWAKLPEIKPADRMEMVQSTLVYVLALFTPRSKLNLPKARDYSVVLRPI